MTLNLKKLAIAKKKSGTSNTKAEILKKILSTLKLEGHHAKDGRGVYVSTPSPIAFEKLKVKLKENRFKTKLGDDEGDLIVMT